MTAYSDKGYGIRFLERCSEADVHSEQPNCSSNRDSPECEI